MTEKSYYWDGTATGDATEAPYSADLYVSLWKKLFTRNDNEGVVNDYLLELLVSGIAGGVIVSSGGAVVAGSFYENTADVTITIPTPTTDPRIDRIVIQKDWGAQTIRATRIAGTENPAPTAPAITQTLGSIWEIPLAQVLITTAGVITVTDERENCVTPLASRDAFILIEHQESDGTFTQFDFSDISQIYTHLQIEFHGKHSYNAFPFSAFALVARFNGDADTNYNTQYVFGAVAVTGGEAFINRTGAIFGSVPTSWSTTALYPGQATGFISNYRGSIYKTIHGILARFNTDVNSAALTGGAIWLNTSEITRITVLAPEAPSGTFLAGSFCSLYGIKS